MGLGMALGDHKTTRFQRYSYVCLLANSHRYQGRKKQVKVGGGGLWLSGALFHKKRAPSSKFIYGGYTTQLSLKLLNSECL